MKRIIITLLVALIATPIFAQDRITIKQLSDGVCDCLKSKKTDYSKPENVNKEFIACFTEGDILSQLMGYAKDKDIDFGDNSEMEKIGKDIGFQLVQDKCPPFMKLVEGEIRKEVEKDDNTETAFITGKLLRVEIKEFAYLVIQGEKNREVSVIWIQPFEGSERFKGENLEKMKNKTLKVKYQLKEAYLPKVGDYYQIKEILSVEEKN
jgi:hypothetical protein